MKSEKYLPFLLVSLLFLSIGACEELPSIMVDCDEDCFDYKPDTADLLIYVTFNEENPFVPLVLYRGKVGGGEVDYVDTAYDSPHHLPSKVGQYYSLTAEYNTSDGGKIIAVDGDVMKLRNATESCGYECWVIKGGYLKVELKFDD